MGEYSSMKRQKKKIYILKKKKKKKWFGIVLWNSHDYDLWMGLDGL
jgi:hypothetical protein